MGNALSSNSTSSTPRLYEDIRLLLADPEKRFPEEFDPQRPFKDKVLKRVSQSGFSQKVILEEGVGVVPRERFDPQALEEVAPLDVELRNGATYIIVPRDRMTKEKRENDFLKWFEQAQYGDDPCSPFQASGASCDVSAPSDSPGNGPTAPAALPRRVGRLLAPLRGSATLVRPCLVNRVAGSRPSVWKPR